jgi:hypothetical protein
MDKVVPMIIAISEEIMRNIDTERTAGDVLKISI